MSGGAAAHPRVRLVALAGSLRRASFNLALVRAAVEVAPPDCELHVATLAGIPVYDGDVEERSGVPPAVAALQDRLAASDGLLIATPEYNGSLPGPLKNAIDWASRPPQDIPRVFGGLPMALMGATPGRGGTRLSQTAWLPVLRALGAQAFFGRSLFIDGAAALFDATGTLLDAALRERLRTLVAEFAAFAKAHPRPARAPR